MFLSFSEESFTKELYSTLHRTDEALLLFSPPHPPLSFFQYNDSNYVQTTKHASSNDSTDTGEIGSFAQ